MKERDDNNLNFRDDSRFDPNTNILNQEGLDNIPNQNYQDDNDVTKNSLKRAGVFEAMMNRNKGNNQDGNDNPVNPFDKNDKPYNQDYPADDEIEDNLNINELIKEKEQNQIQEQNNQLEDQSEINNQPNNNNQPENNDQPENNNQPENNDQPNNNGQNNNDNNLDAQIASLMAQQQQLNRQIAALQAQKNGQQPQNNNANQQPQNNQANQQLQNNQVNLQLQNNPEGRSQRDRDLGKYTSSLNGYQLSKDGKKVEKFFFWDDITPQQRDHQIKQSEANGYSTKETVKQTLTDSQADRVESMTIYARQLGKYAKFGKKSPLFKEMIKDLEALDKFMQEIGGRTRLTADEMEAYDMLTLKAYNSTLNYEDYKNKQINQRKKVKDPYKNGEEVAPVKESEKVRLKGVAEIRQGLGKLREDMFKDEIDQKAKEMQAKCDEQVDKLEEEREKLAQLPSVPGGENKATREAMEANIANTLFYSNRMADLGKQGKLTMNPGKALGQNFNNLDKDISPNYSSLEAVKKTPLFKDVVDAAMAKVEKGETITTEEIQSIQQAYVKKLGNKKRRSNQLNKNINNTKKKGPQDPQVGANQPRPAM